MASLNILISGCGVAGPVIAYWLLRGDPSHRITIVERSKEIRLTGQSVDLRHGAVDIIQQMGVEAEIRQKLTHEAGLDFVASSGRSYGKFGTTGDVKQQSFSSEFEIFRGDLARIFLATVEDKVELATDEYVSSFDQDGDKVHVKFSNGREPGTYDLVLAADGYSSKIRNQALGTTANPREHYRELDSFAVFFTQDADLLKGERFAQWYTAGRGRVFFVRPDIEPNRSRVNLIKNVMGQDPATIARWRDAHRKGNDALKQFYVDEFRGAGWLEDEILDGMIRSDDFYCTEVVQVKAPKLAVGRVAFVGDAGFAPTFFTGMGTSIALIGSYVIAGEINKAVREGRPVDSALQRYEDIVLPYVRGVQDLPPFVPSAMLPQSWWGVYIQRVVVGIVSTLKLDVLFGKLAGATAVTEGKWKLPQYDWIS